MISTNEQNWKPRSSGKQPIVMSRVHGGFGKHWRCTCCGKLLGIIEGTWMHFKVSHGGEYFTGFPAIGTCPRCGTLNKYGENSSEPEPIPHN